MSNTLLNGLVTFYKIDEGTGTTVNDAVGTDNLSFFSSVNWVTGIAAGGAVSSAGGYINGGATSGPVTGSGDLTVGLWFSTTDTSAGTHPIVGWGTNSAGQMINLSLENGVLWDRSAGGQTTHGGSGYNDGSPHLWVMRKPSGASIASMTFSLDTASVALTSAGTTTINLTNGTLYLLSGPVSGGFTGTLYAVGIWNTILSTSDEAAWYNGGTGIPYSSFSSGGGGSIILPPYLFDTMAI